MTFRKIISTLIATAVALLLTGCGASVTVYDFSDGENHYNMYELTFDSDTLSRMESSAATDPNGNKYTVEKYFADFFADFGYSLDSAEKTDKQYTVRYRKAVGQGGELNELGTPVEFTATSTENMFLRYYTMTSPNPFNGVKAKYDAVQPYQSVTPLDRLKNGSVAFDGKGELIVSAPALTEAFPYLKTVGEDGLLLNYVRYGSPRMQSSGTEVKLDDDTAAYIFSRYFDDVEDSMELTFSRPVPYGWYLVAVLMGALVFGVIMLQTRPKKKLLTPPPNNNIMDIDPFDNSAVNDIDPFDGNDF